MDNENMNTIIIEEETDVIIETLGEEETFEQVEETFETLEHETTRGKLAAPHVDEVLALAAEMGAVLDEKVKSWHKVVADPYNKKAVYVSKTKRGLTRVDISGFTVEHPCISDVSPEDAKEENIGRVKQQILPKQLEPGADVLGALRVAFEGLVSNTEGDKLGSRKDQELAASGE